MTYTYDLNEGGRLVLKADAEDRARLEELIAETMARNPEWSREGATCAIEAEALEPITCNSELEWIDPAETGDLTSAPMLGIRDSDTEDGPTYEGKVIARWAYMDYQVRSFVDDLIERGEAIFVS